MRTSGDEQLSITNSNPDCVIKNIDNNYESVINILKQGHWVVGPCFMFVSVIRDGCGYCQPTHIAPGQQYFIGYSDNHNRPGILCQSGTDLPRGREIVKLPSGTTFKMKPGQYFVDALDFDIILAGSVLTVAH